MIGIGTAKEGRQKAAEGSVFVINVAEVELNPSAHLCCPVNDGDEQKPRFSIAVLDGLATIIQEKVNEGQEVFVHCEGGLWRSPLVVAWYYKRYGNMSLAQAYEKVRKIRPNLKEVLDWMIVRP